MMKHKPFEKLLQPFLTKEEQMTTTEAVTRKKATKAMVKVAVKLAKKMRQENPSLTLKEMASKVGVSPLTLGKHLRGKGKFGTRGPYQKRAKLVAKTSDATKVDEETLRTNFLVARAEYTRAKKAYLEHLEREGV
jgi:hypothetical protein